MKVHFYQISYSNIKTIYIRFLTNFMVATKTFSTYASRGSDAFNKTKKINIDLDCYLYDALFAHISQEGGLHIDEQMLVSL